ncbi:MAG: putative Ig domain-containing protein, partial [Synergistaceae bacterium]|nr:putative Ig domain-containing protein [Synergistaceae bacterium]
MKKFFALMVTVAMLLVAGSAMAADPTISLSQTTLSIQAGGTAQTVTATATPGHGGRMSSIGVADSAVVEWIAVQGNTVTITVAPDKSVRPGTYPVTVTAVETYTDSAAGHS